MLTSVTRMLRWVASSESREQCSTKIDISASISSRLRFQFSVEKA